jgi:hypothetical protein
MASGIMVADSFLRATTAVMPRTKAAVAWNASGFDCARGVETRVSNARSSSPLSILAHSNTFRSSAALYSSSTCAERRTASKSEKKPPATSSDGHESRRWREGTATPQNAEIAPP